MSSTNSKKSDSSKSLYESLSSDNDDNKKSSKTSVLSVLSKSKIKQIPSSKQQDYEIVTKCHVELLRHGPGDSLVAIYCRPLEMSNGSGLCGNLSRPIYLFTESVKWKTATSIMMNQLRSDGVYFISIIWNLKRVYKLANGKSMTSQKPKILHCICKEPMKRYQGRIGPISTFIPHWSEGKRIGGLWVSLFSDQIYAEFIEQLNPFRKEYREKLKSVGKKIEQVLFFVSNDSACVGIQVLNTKQEEREIKKSKKVFHHERPLILQDGYYLVEGYFVPKYLNMNATTSKKLQFDGITGPLIVILGEGTHLIRTQTEPVLQLSTQPNKTESNSKNDLKSRSMQKSWRKLAEKSNESKKMLQSDPKMKTKTKMEKNLPKISKILPSKDNSSQLEVPKTAKTRTVELCLDYSYDGIIALDNFVLSQDWRLKV
ncbi:hypothetical protein RDWZM_006074 [Blomia tropicalis]|uniref:Uncharacterized protein n=1 Tax=Blomia tropicalis TaxID=40697 RepID=A0A9Q0M9P7_BLOTA|nr:hypothetical protein RDWZM_006074 [Blomia tropicalis]